MTIKRLYLLLICSLAVTLFLPGCDKKKIKKTANIIEINSIPQGATVFYKNKEKGITPFKFGAIPKTFVFKVQKTGYEPQWIPITMEKSDITKNVKLKPITADILITSKPSEAKVIIDGTEIGETPLILKNQPLGQSKAVIKKIGYVSKPKSWTIKDARPIKISAQLKSNVGILVLESKPSEAEVFINDQYKGITPLRKKVEQGKLHVVIKKEGFTTFEEDIISKRNQTVSRKIILHVLPGSIRVTSTPKNATIYVDGSEYSKKTPAIIDKLVPRKYSIKVEKSGFAPIVKQVEVKRGTRKRLNFELGVNTGGIDLVANPPGVSVYLDGRLHGTTEQDEDKKYSRIYKIRGLKEGTHLIRVAHKRARPEHKSIKVVVKRGKTTRTKTINLWIANAELKLKSGRKMVGCLRSETPLEVFFEPEPGVRQGFRRDEIEYLKMLKKVE